MDIVFLVIGIVVGGVIGFLAARLTSKKTPDAEIPQNNGQDLKLKNSRLEERLSLLNTEKENQRQEWERERSRYEKELQESREHFVAAQSKISELNALHKGTEEKLATQKEELEKLQQKFTKDFELIANKLLEDKSQKFTEQNKTNLDIILNPLKEKIKDFEQKVEKAYSEENKERITLKTEIKNLVDLNKQISEEANNLATALKGNNKTQGNWGEMILERILEVSGLTKDVEYKTQFSTTNEDGKRLQPDVLIMLPEGKNLVIDSKVSLVAYEQFINTEDDLEKERFLKQHVDSVRMHIKGLSDKKYTELTGVNSPDFILLFIPIEASFAAALQLDPEIYNYAWERKIVLVSPTTLLATLRTVSSVWKQEKQVKNALNIAEQAGNMYDKFVAITEDLLKVGAAIDSSKKSYAAAMNKFVEGRGNLIKRAQDLKELGVKTSKNFDPRLLDRSSIENTNEETKES